MMRKHVPALLALAPFVFCLLAAPALTAQAPASIAVPQIQGLPATARAAAASDEYHPNWDFRSNAKLARFGFVLGWLAGAQLHSIERNPGDEFAAPRKASEAH